MPVTQKQIAEHLNLSRSLVARALKGYPDVAEATRQRIQEASRSMGYDQSANLEARSLIARRYGQRLSRGVFALALAAELVTTPRALPYFAPFFAGVEDEAAHLGIEVCLCSFRSTELPRLIRDGAVDGVLSLGHSSEQGIEMVRLGLPVVGLAQRNCTHCIVCDERDGARRATRHLLELGHRSIAYIGVPADGPGGDAGALRLQGYLDAMRAYKIAVQPGWVQALPLPDTSQGSYCSGCGKCAACLGWTQLSASTTDEITAVVCHNDPVAMGVIEHATREGRSVPGDLSVVGFDNISAQYNFKPLITSVDSPRHEMGRHAIRLLHDVFEAKLQAGAPEEVPVMDDVKAQPEYCQVFPMTFCEHETTALAPAGPI